MNNYVLEVKEGQSNSAGTKAKEDITYFLKEKNFKDISIQIPSNRIMRVLFGKKIVSKSLRDVNSGTFVFQYPMYSRVISNYALNNLSNKKEIEKILVIHDVESLRLNKDEHDAVDKEIGFFNKFDKVISHNQKMTDWLLSNGLAVPVKNLEIFDYNNPQKIIKNSYEKSIVFAGNLSKSKFLNKLNIKSNVYIMGPGASDEYPNNIHYEGMFTPEEVPAHLGKGFGLVWDGDSIDECNGLFGEYMKFNNPHKVSLYLSSGIPVIIWSKSAMADFISKNKLGIVVDSLNNIDSVLDGVTEEKYNFLKKNVEKVAVDLRSGKYIYNAVVG